MKQDIKPTFYSFAQSPVLGLVKYLESSYFIHAIWINSHTPGGVYNVQSEEFIQ